MWLLFQRPFTLQLSDRHKGGTRRRLAAAHRALQRDLALADQSGGERSRGGNRCRDVVVGDVRSGAGQRS